MAYMNSYKPSTSALKSKSGQFRSVGFKGSDFDFVLIGLIDQVLINLPNSLNKSNFSTLAVGTPGMYLMKTRKINKRIEIATNDTKIFLDYLLSHRDLISQIEGSVLWYGDGIMREITKRKMPLKLKQNLLPIKNPKYFKILGSKSGQDQVFRELGINTPKGNILYRNTKMKPKINRSKKVWLIKGDPDGGGAYIKVIKPKEKFLLDAIPQFWYPILLQEYVEGDVISVDAFYKNGELYAWLYSSFDDVISLLGPSLSRIYFAPQNQDFLEGLRTLGEKAQIDGMVNATYIWNKKMKKHFLIEFDARPNTWHHAYSDFGIPLKELMNAKSTYSVEKYFAKPKQIYEPNRLFNRYLESNQYFRALGVLIGFRIPSKGSPVSSSFYDFEIRVKNLKRLSRNSTSGLFNFLDSEKRRAKRIIGLALIKIGIVIKRWLPTPIKEMLNKASWREKLIGRLSG